MIRNGRGAEYQIPHAGRGFAHAKNLLLLACAFLAITFACKISWSPGISGDGFEYMAMSEAIVRHATPDVRVADIRQLVERDPHDAMLVRLSGELSGSLVHGQGASGFSITRDGRAYSYHFWFYPLINVPAMAACQWFGITPDNSFLLTNAALLLALIALITLGTDWPYRRKAILAFLILACGGTFYLDWPSPEVMTFAFLLAGLVLLESRLYGLALITFAIAAQQNPPVGFLAILTGGIACWKTLIQWRIRKNTRSAVFSLLRLGPGAILLIASPLFYWTNFGSPSLIIRAGSTNVSLISAGRLFSLFFDPNQGMILAMPAVFLVFIIFLAINAGFSRRNTWIALSLLGLMILLAIPALSQTNWNAGSTIISRYAFWLSALLLYAVAFLLSNTRRKHLFVVGAALIVVTQVGLLRFYGVRGDYGVNGKNKWGYLFPSPFATWLMDQHPSWYEPLPEIFVERGTHIDGGMRDGRTYFYVNDGYVRTFISQSGHPFAINAVCSVGNDQFRTHQRELHWAYWYIGDDCRTKIMDGFYALPDDPKALAVGVSNFLNNASDYIEPGFPGLKAPENWGVWTNQRFAAVPLLLPAEVDGHRISHWEVTLRFHPFVRSPESISSQHVIVFANGTEVLNMRLTASASVERTFLAASRSWSNSKSSLLLGFNIPTAKSYKELGLSQDSSRLGIGLESVRVVPAANTNTGQRTWQRSNDAADLRADHARPYTSSSRTMSSSPR